MRSSAALLSLLSLLLACAPAPPGLPVLGSAPPPPPPAPPPGPARWTIDTPLFEAAATLRLPSGRVLSVQGKQRVVGDERADSLPPVSLVDVRADGAGILVLGHEGSVFTAKELLGRLNRVRPALAGVWHFALGKSAILGLGDDGTVHRAADAAAPWVRSPLGLRRGESVISLASDRKGRFAVLLRPQRLLVSNDDGATFRRVALTGKGAVGLERDFDDELWIRTGARDADNLPVPAGRIALDQRVDAGGKPSRAPTPERGARVHWFAAGDRRVRVRLPKEKGTVKLSIGPWNGPMGPERTTVFDGDVWDVEAVGYQSDVTLAIRWPGGLRLSQTSDDGHTLRELGSFDRSMDRSALLAAGPDGWVLTSRVCKGAECQPQVWVQGRWTTWNSPAPRLAAWGRDRGWVLDGARVFEVRPGAPEGTEAGVSLASVIALTAGKDDELRAILASPSRVVRVKGSEVEVLGYLPEEAHLAALSGEHGLFQTRVGAKSFETVDGGLSWMPVGLPEAIRACSAGGCSTTSAVRVGWDQPATLEDRVKLATVAPAPPPSAPPAAPPIDLTCTYESTKFAALGISKTWIDDFGLDKDTRMLALGALVPGKEHERQTLLLAVSGGGAPKVVRGPKGRVFHDRSGEAGSVLAAFQFGPKPAVNAYAPVDVDLAWFDAASGKSGSAKLAKVAPFRVGANNLGAFLTPVEGGALLYPFSPDARIHLALAGRTETYAPPPGAAWLFGQAVRAGSVLALAAREGDDTFIALTKDKGKTWRTTRWTTGEASLTVVAGKPALALGEADLSAVVPLDDLGPDIPDWTPVRAAGLLDGCDPKRPTGAPWIAFDRPDVRFLLKDTTGKEGSSEHLLTTQVARSRADGTRCTAVLTAGLPDRETLVLVAPHDLTNGHFFRVNAAKGELGWTKLSCKKP